MKDLKIEKSAGTPLYEDVNVNVIQLLLLKSNTSVKYFKKPRSVWLIGAKIKTLFPQLSIFSSTNVQVNVTNQQRFSLKKISTNRNLWKYLEVGLGD